MTTKVTNKVQSYKSEIGSRLLEVSTRTEDKMSGVLRCKPDIEGRAAGDRSDDPGNDARGLEFWI